MERFEALSRLIWSAIPAEASVPLGLLTALGSATFLLFWLDERRSTAAVISYALVALAVVITLKTALKLPRPPASVRLIPLEHDPYGFPSGHAVASVVYGGLATLRDRLSDRRVLAGIAVVVLVAFSRVALGMHYLGDVLVGAVLGLVVLGLCWRVVEDNPIRGFALAAVVSVPALVVTAYSPDALLAFGGSLGGIVGSFRIDTVKSRISVLDGFVLVLVGIPFIFAVEIFAERLTTPAVAIAVYALLVAGILGLPTVVERLPLASIRSFGESRRT